MKNLAVFLLLSELLAGQDRPEVAEVLRQGTRLVERGQLAAAQELYEKTRGSFPSDPDLTFELGMVYFRQHNWEKAAENYSRSLSIRPGRVKPLFYLAEVYYLESNLDLARETRIIERAILVPQTGDDARVSGARLVVLAFLIEFYVP